MTTLCSHLGSAPFELILSSGFFGFFAHAGVVAALEELGLCPSAVGGSSAGALIAGLYGAGLPVEEIKKRLFALRRDDFWDVDPRLGIGRGMGLLKGQRFQNLLQEALLTVGVFDFADCRIPVRVVVHDSKQRRPVVLDKGGLAEAIRASCTVPVLFQPAQIEGRSYLDGGVSDRAGIGAASSGARVLFHHLPTNSPWRYVFRSQNGVPAWPDLHLLHEPTLPRLSPFHLSRGPRAFALAREMALRILNGPVGPVGRGY